MNTSSPEAIAEAIDFVNKVKTRFRGQPEKFVEFLDVLMECKPKIKYLERHRNVVDAVHVEEMNHSMAAQVYQKISSLFENDHDLLSEFLLYLPAQVNQYSSEQTESEIKNIINDSYSGGQIQAPDRYSFNDAINFVDKVKSRLQNEPEKYRKFLQVIATYKKEQASFNAKNSNDDDNVSANAKECLRVAEIYRVVTQLLKNHDDLIQEFKNFIIPDQPENGSNNRPSGKLEYAMSYIEQIKRQFHDQPKIYEKFLDIMKEFNHGRINATQVIGEVTSLFEGYPELIVGFNTFLPSGFKIEHQTNEQSQVEYQVSIPTCMLTQKMLLEPQTDFVETNSAPSAPESPDQNLRRMLKVEDALSYLDLVKRKCSHEPQVYEEFLRIMVEYKSKKINALGIITQICRLFKNQLDLIVGLRSFLPSGYHLQVDLKDHGPEYDVSLILPDHSTVHMMAPLLQLSSRPEINTYLLQNMYQLRAHVLHTIHSALRDPSKRAANIHMHFHYNVEPMISTRRLLGKLHNLVL